MIIECRNNDEVMDKIKVIQETLNGFGIRTKTAKGVSVGNGKIVHRVDFLNKEGQQQSWVLQNNSKKERHEVFGK